MTRHVYVGNLSFETTEETLKTTFEQDGRTVTAVSIVKDHRKGKSRGFAFIEMQDEEQATGAIASLDGADVDGREIKVAEGKERPEFRMSSPGGPSKWASRGGGRGRH